MNKVTRLRDVLRLPVHMALCADIRKLDYGTFYDFLDGAEIDRASRFINEDAQKRFVFAHGLKRFCLSHLMNVEPQAVIFATNDFGKPYVNQADVPYFNLSHSDNWVVIAISSLSQVGVDLEFPAHFPFWNVANMVLSEKELVSLKESPTWQKFLSYWTQKEALSKTCGLGLSLDFPTIPVSGTFELQEIVFKEKGYFLKSFTREEEGVLTVAANSSTPFQVYDLLDWSSGSLEVFFRTTKA